MQEQKCSTIEGKWSLHCPFLLPKSQQYFVLSKFSIYVREKIFVYPV